MEIVDKPSDLAAVVDGLFANSVTSFTTERGIHVEFKRAGIVQLGKVSKFFDIIMAKAAPEKINEFITLLAGEQKMLMDEGKSVYDMNLNASTMIEKFMGNQSLLLSVFSATADVIPEFVSIFATVTEEQYMELSLDEQLVIAAGVFIVNYGFFTQSLPPIIKSVMRGLQQKREEMLKIESGKLAAKSQSKAP